MAMYYYASRLNEASCSSGRCSMRMPPSHAEPAQVPPPPEQAPTVAPRRSGQASIVDPRRLDQASIVDPRRLDQASVVDPRRLDQASIVDPRGLDQASIIDPRRLDQASIVDPRRLDQASIVNPRRLDQASIVDPRQLDQASGVDLRRFEQATFGDPRRLEQVPFSDPRPLEQAPIGDLRQLEQAPFSDPRRLEQASISDPRQLEQAPIGNPRRWEKSQIGDPRLLEQAPISDPRQLEQAPIGNPRRLEKSQISDPKLLDQAPIGDPRLLEQASIAAPRRVEQAPIVANPALLRAGNGLSYYDNDDYYSMARGNRFMSENPCPHLVMNSGINFMTSQIVDAPQMQPVMAPRGLAMLPYVNYGSERPDIEYRDGQIITGTLEALSDLLRPSATKSFKFTFLLCFRLFMKPHELLSKLCKKYFKNYDILKERSNVDLLRNEKEDMVSLVSLFSEWTIMFPYDFRDDKVMALVRVISERCSAEHMTEVRVDMSNTLETLLDKLTALEQYEKTLTEIPQMRCVDHLSQDDILSLGLTPIAFAHQLTLVELYRLSFVGPEEFVQTFAPHSTSPHSSAPASAKASIKLHHVESKCTRNLEAYADWFNRLSYLVASDILKSMKSKYRARVIEQWVMTARECFNLGNFNSLMAIISALNMAPITRLKKTWSRTSPVCGQQLRQLELCVEPSGNHARYRAALAAAPSETAVPLLSVTCRDLHFANQGAPSKLPGNRVNFEKWSILARFVDSHLAARRLTGAGTPPAAAGQRHLAAWRFLTDRPTLTEIALELTSYERESPVDNLEKERCKRLRCSS